MANRQRNNHRGEQMNNMEMSKNRKKHVFLKHS